MSINYDKWNNSMYNDVSDEDDEDDDDSFDPPGVQSLVVSDFKCTSIQTNPNSRWTYV